MNVFSAFDGLSAARIALHRLGITPDVYYASEIDKYAIQVACRNYCDTIQLGDITTIDAARLAQFTDLLIGGSPCQDLSIAAKNRKGLQGSRSGLFYQYLRLRDVLKPTYFLLENVASMSRESRDIITSEMGVEPIMINSSFVSAQHRKRLYWTNIPNVTQPEDKHIYLRDILESGDVDVDKSYCIDANYYKGTNLEHYLTNSMSQIVFEPKDSPDKVGFINQDHRGGRVYSVNGKSVTLASNGGGWGTKTGLYAKPVRVGHVGDNDGQGNRIYGDNGKSQALTANPNGGTKLDWYAAAVRGRYNEDGTTSQRLETNQNEKANALTSVWKDSCLAAELTEHYIIRKLTPIECERLQTIPDNYTAGVSNTQRYKMIGNSFTVDVIAHILSHIPT